MNHTGKPLIVIAGPTATGKSDLAAELARRINGEVVSADSMQVYRHMDIGSAKVTLEEMLGVPHHMIDVCEPDDAMDAARYAEEAGACIRDIHERGRIPVLCGGTGFYIQAVVNGIDFSENAPSEEYRRALAAYAEEHGYEALHARLAEEDPDAAAEIHPNNVKRVIRALEFCRENGDRISEHNRRERERHTPYDLMFFVLTDDRGILYKRIDDRVSFMDAEGLFDEVAYLRAMGLDRGCVSMQGIGYKEVLDYMDGLCTREEALDRIRLGSRHYAKRQITWFKREKDAIWLNRQDFGGDTFAILDEVLSRVSEHYGIIPLKVRDPHT